MLLNADCQKDEVSVQKKTNKRTKRKQNPAVLLFKKKGKKKTGVKVTNIDFGAQNSTLMHYFIDNGIRSLFSSFTFEDNTC